MLIVTRYRSSHVSRVSRVKPVHYMEAALFDTGSVEEHRSKRLPPDDTVNKRGKMDLKQKPEHKLSYAHTVKN